MEKKKHVWYLIFHSSFFLTEFLESTKQRTEHSSVPERLSKFIFTIIFIENKTMHKLHAIRASVQFLNFRHRASCILGQAFRYYPENAFYIFNQQIYFII